LAFAIIIIFHFLVILSFFCLTVGFLGLK
jgi:hypothetical protein